MSDEKKSWWKVALCAIGSFLLGIITFLLGGLLRNKRDRADDVRDNLEQAEATNNDIRDTVNSVEQSVDNIKQSNKECSDIINDVRKRGKKTKS